MNPFDEFFGKPTAPQQSTQPAQPEQAEQEDTRKYNYATSKDIFYIALMLRDEALENYDGERAKYRTDWCDARVAETHVQRSGASYISKHHVSKIRTGIFGRVMDMPGKKTIEQKLAELEAEMQRLKARMGK